jgi:hypothetical protein
MKHSRIGLAVAALAVLSCLGPQCGWATRIFSSVVTGTVTSTPTQTQIEVDHRVYHFKPNSVAEKQAHAVEVGQVVDVRLDDTATKGVQTAVSITVHGGN